MKSLIGVSGMEKGPLRAIYSAALAKMTDTASRAEY
jgi:hypothetical protein